MKRLMISPVILMMFSCILLINTGTLKAQPNPGARKEIRIKQNSILKKAETAYQDFKFSIAAGYYDTYLQNPTRSRNEVLAKLADCYWQMRAYDQALRVYLLLYPERIQAAGMQEQHRIAELFARYGQYHLASLWLKEVDGYNLKAKAYNDKGVLDSMKKDSLKWKLGFLNINTVYREFSPFVAYNTLFFSSNKPLPIKTKASGWDGDNFSRLWEISLFDVFNMPANQLNDSLSTGRLMKGTVKKMAEVYEGADNSSLKKNNGLFSDELYLNADLNSTGTLVNGLDRIRYNAGAISMDENNHFYFSANYAKGDKKGINRICLMEGLYTPDGITSIKKLPFGNPDSFSVMHPTVNNEGTLLVCSSDRANGQGGYDLYYSQRKTVSQPWSALKAFGNNINTPGNEVFPSITQNGYLYYSSDWMPGLGGLDIFRIPVKDAIVGKGTPEHLSYPINSSADDFGWCQQDSSGTKGYFTSDRLNNDDNLYSFSYEPVLTVKIPRKSYLEGSVLERQSKRPIKGATVFLYNLKEDSVYVAKTDAKGKYHFPVLNTSKVIIKAVDKAYVKDCFAGNITYVQQPKNTIQKAFRDLLLYNFKIGFTWKLSNIHFDPDKWCIRTDAKPALDSLVSVLKEQPVIVEIGSHTDSRGSSKSNERLSQHRAESVVNYLIQQGVDPARITAKGYGESRLLNKCADGVPCSEEEHQVNNRTEVKIMGYTDLRNEPKSIDPDIFSDGDKIDKNLFPKGYFNDCK